MGKLFQTEAEGGIQLVFWCSELGGERSEINQYMSVCGHMEILFMDKTSCELKLIRKKKSHKNETPPDDRINFY